MAAMIGGSLLKKSGLTSMDGSIKTAATLDKKQMNIGCKFYDDKRGV